jgi:microsomal dipeptidase-like Zn-dependent dipeptidase
MTTTEHSGEQAARQPADAPRVPLGGDYWQAEPAAPLWGLADPHTHLMAHLAFGGKAFWGQSYDPDHTGDEAMAHVLGSCAPIHGGFLNVNPEFGHVPGGGWPDFHVWPRFTTLVHQQAYVDWLYRAYQGGLRLVSCLAVNNELLASKTNPNAVHDDRTAIMTQVAAMKEMAAWTDRQAGGPGQGWMQIAYTPDEAAQIVGANRLAVILGVEVDSLGNWRRASDLEKFAGGEPDKARYLISSELDWLYGLGIRQITPIHLSSNAFGGTAFYLRFLELSNVYLTGEPWEVRDAFASGVRYRVDQDGADLKDEVERRIASLGPTLGPHIAMNRRTLIDTLPGLGEFADHAAAPDLKGGHANTVGLRSYGIILLEEMMKRGMIIDIDHMSELASNAALDIVEAHDYPVISSHGWYRDLTYTSNLPFEPPNFASYGTDDVHKTPHEGARTAEQFDRISRLGGLVAPILNQGDLAGLRATMPDLAGKIKEPCAGSATSWAQAYLYAVRKMGGRGVGLGSDINGAAALPGPRFGTFAAYGAASDARRAAERRGEIDRQSNGVKYDRPIRDYRWYRFGDSGPGAYDEDERETWQAVAEYKAGFDPDQQGHPDEDFPEAELLTILDRLHQHLDQNKIDNIARGFWAAERALHAPGSGAGQGRAVGAAARAKWPPEQQAAYLARHGDHLEAGDPQAPLVNKMRAILTRWDMMDGDNAPLVRCTAGARRDFDINLDGMAHYGMLPDFLQDLRNVGLTAEDLAPLFRSAYDYVQTWQKCVSRAGVMAAQVPAGGAAPATVQVTTVVQIPEPDAGAGSRAVPGQSTGRRLDEAEPHGNGKPAAPKPRRRRKAKS